MAVQRGLQQRFGNRFAGCSSAVLGRLGKFQVQVIGRLRPGCFTCPKKPHGGSGPLTSAPPRASRLFAACRQSRGRGVEGCRARQPPSTEPARDEDPAQLPATVRSGGSGSGNGGDIGKRSGRIGEIRHQDRPPPPPALPAHLAGRFQGQPGLSTPAVAEPAGHRDRIRQGESQTGVPRALESRVPHPGWRTRTLRSVPSESDGGTASGDAGTASPSRDDPCPMIGRLRRRRGAGCWERMCWTVWAFGGRVGEETGRGLRDETRPRQKAPIGLRPRRTVPDATPSKPCDQAAEQRWRPQPEAAAERSFLVQARRSAQISEKKLTGRGGKVLDADRPPTPRRPIVTRPAAEPADMPPAR